MRLAPSRTWPAPCLLAPFPGPRAAPGPGRPGRPRVSRPPPGRSQVRNAPPGLTRSRPCQGREPLDGTQTPPGPPPAARTAAWPRPHPPEPGKGTAGGDRHRRAAASSAKPSPRGSPRRLRRPEGSARRALPLPASRLRAGPGGSDAGPGPRGLSDREGRLQMGPRHSERGCGAHAPPSTHTRKHTHRQTHKHTPDTYHIPTCHTLHTQMQTPHHMHTPHTHRRPYPHMHHRHHTRPRQHLRANAWVAEAGAGRRRCGAPTCGHANQDLQSADSRTLSKGQDFSAWTGSEG